MSTVEQARANLAAAQERYNAAVEAIGARAGDSLAESLLDDGKPSVNLSGLLKEPLDLRSDRDDALDVLDVPGVSVGGEHDKRGDQSEHPGNEFRRQADALRVMVERIEEDREVELRRASDFLGKCIREMAQMFTVDLHSLAPSSLAGSRSVATPGAVSGSSFDSAGGTR